MRTAALHSREPCFAWTIKTQDDIIQAITVTVRA